MKKLLAKIVDKFIGPIRDGVRKINKKLDSFFDFSWTVGSLFAKIGFIVQGIFSLVFGLASLLFAVLNFGSIVDLVRGTVRGQSFWMEKLQNVLSGYPSFASLVDAMDAELGSIGNYFTPPLTFSRVLAVTGIGDAVNSIIVCAVQGVAFVISMRLLFWSLARVKLRMIKPIK